jgi:hypothetical protein
MSSGVLLQGQFWESSGTLPTINCFVQKEIFYSVSTDQPPHAFCLLSFSPNHTLTHNGILVSLRVPDTFGGLISGPENSGSFCSPTVSGLAFPEAKPVASGGNQASGQAAQQMWQFQVTNEHRLQRGSSVVMESRQSLNDYPKDNDLYH